MTSAWSLRRNHRRGVFRGGKQGERSVAVPVGLVSVLVLVSAVGDQKMDDGSEMVLRVCPGPECYLNR